MSNNNLGLLALSLLSFGTVAACSNERSDDTVPGAAISKDKAEAPDTEVSAATEAEEAPVSEVELALEDVAGGWRVIGVENGDSAIKGAIAEIYPESLSWSFKPKGATGLDQYCAEPVAGLVVREMARKEIGEALQPLIGNVGAGPPHEWLCGAGGDWGPESGADFVIRADGRMVMRWREGAVLMLEKLDRPKPKADMQPEDYKADTAE